jgi:ABC-type Na+ efflux pump permease subunit
MSDTPPPPEPIPDPPDSAATNPDLKRDDGPPPLAEPPPLPPRSKRRRKLFRRPPTKEPRVPFFKRFTNALLGWEVMRAGRRTGSIAIARTALGGSLLAAIWVLYAAQFGEDAKFTDSGTEIGKQLNTFAERFALTFFVVQSLAVLLLTPVYVASAIFEERDTRSGEVLLTTQLTRREVYVGKLGARMVQVLLVVLAGMPILFLTSLWGGVGIEMIIICYTATFTAIFGAGVVTAAVSAYAETMRAALLRTYLMLALLDGALIISSPFLVIFTASQHWGVGLFFLIVYLPMQLIIVIVGYFIGQRWLRMAMLRQKRTLQPRYGKPPPLPGKDGRLPPLRDDVDPLIWKEINTGNRVSFIEGLSCLTRFPDASSNDNIDDMGFVRWLFVARDGTAYFFRVVLLLITLTLVVLIVTNVIPSEWAVRVFGLAIVLWMMAAVGLTAASGISKERQKQTLIDLLMLPGPRSDLLKAKVMGAMVRTLWPTIML